MADWHPIMAAVEGPPGVWRMVAPDGGEYGRIELRRVGNGTQLRYKAIWRGEVIGWAATLREACWRVHSAYLRSHGPAGGALADWGDATRRAERRLVGRSSHRGSAGATAAAAAGGDAQTDQHESDHQHDGADDRP